MTPRPIHKLTLLVAAIIGAIAAIIANSRGKK